MKKYSAFNFYTSDCIQIIEAENPFDAFLKIDVNDPEELGEIWIECDGQYFGITREGETYEIQ